MLILSLSFGIIPRFIFSQNDTIWLENPSFESAYHGPGYVPKPWLNCGFEGETPPDVQPGAFGVTLIPADGDTYLGLVTRQNRSWEAIGQRLKHAFIPGFNYHWSIRLARDTVYLGANRSSPKDSINHLAPVLIRIWSGRRPCERKELLAVSAPIQHHEWQDVSFHFAPKQKGNRYLLIEVIAAGALGREPGHVLMDDAAPIVGFPPGNMAKDADPDVLRQLAKSRIKYLKDLKQVKRK